MLCLFLIESIWGSGAAAYGRSGGSGRGGRGRERGRGRGRGRRSTDGGMWPRVGSGGWPEGGCGGGSPASGGRAGRRGEGAPPPPGADAHGRGEEGGGGVGGGSVGSGGGGGGGDSGRGGIEGKGGGASARAGAAVDRQPRRRQATASVCTARAATRRGRGGVTGGQLSRSRGPFPPPPVGRRPGAAGHGRPRGGGACAPWRPAGCQRAPSSPLPPPPPPPAEVPPPPKSAGCGPRAPAQRPGGEGGTPTHPGNRACAGTRASTRARRANRHS